MVSPCQTQTGPNETQTNLLTGFVSLQTDISWQPRRNICENEILDPHVTAAVIWLRVDVSSAETFFEPPQLQQQLHFLRVHLPPVCTGFAPFSLSSPHFNLKFVRWAAVGGRMQIEGTQHFIQKLLHLLFGTILVEGNTQIVHESFKPEVSKFEFAILTAWLQPPRTASVSFFYNSCGNCRSLSHEAWCNNMFPGLGVN